ncbi:tetratricopeptide repeat protein [bacterium]|nr:tetratricopeptide repeat protein [bacterium]
MKRVFRYRLETISILLCSLFIVFGSTLLYPPSLAQCQEATLTHEKTTSETHGVTPPEHPVGKTELYAALDEQYAGCNTLSKRESALEELRELLKATPNDYELLWRAARLTWFIGDWLEDDQSERLETLGIEGMDWADRAMKLNPQGLEGHYYKALAISNYSRGISIVKALIKGLANDYVAHLEHVLKNDRAFDQGGPLRAMGRYYWKLPWPKYDYKQSLKYLDQALEVNPDVLRTHFYRADTLWALKKYQEARVAFEYVLETDPKPFDIKDVPWIKDQAKERLELLLKEEF